MSVGRVVRTRVFHSLRLYKDVNQIIIIIIIMDYNIMDKTSEFRKSQKLWSLDLN